MGWTEDLNEVVERQRAHRLRAEQLVQARFAHCQQLCIEAGVGGHCWSLMAHNAMCGKPWPNVDYAKLKIVKQLESTAWRPMDVLDHWWAEDLLVLYERYAGECPATSYLRQKVKEAHARANQPQGMATEDDVRGRGRLTVIHGGLSESTRGQVERAA